MLPCETGALGLPVAAHLGLPIAAVPDIAVIALLQAHPHVPHLHGYLFLSGLGFCGQNGGGQHSGGHDSGYDVSHCRVSMVAGQLHCCPHR